MKDLKLFCRDVRKSNSPCIVHSDLFFPTRFLIRTPPTNTILLIREHIKLLEECLESQKIWFPSFNYDFCKGQDFDVMNTPSQVGPLTEEVRKAYASWRTFDPVFSFAGYSTTSPSLGIRKKINPFDTMSVFHELTSLSGFVVLYGTSLKSSTIIHYAEYLSKNLIYRYNKRFTGNIIDCDNRYHKIKFDYHVRPLGTSIDYDWKKIEDELKKEQILHTYKFKNIGIFSIYNAKEFTEWVNSKMRQDPFYLLSSKSREYCEDLYLRLGRPFEISDFE